jgi:hypothetical protein
MEAAMAFEHAPPRSISSLDRPTLEGIWLGAGLPREVLPAREFSSGLRAVTSRAGYSARAEYFEPPTLAEAFR